MPLLKYPYEALQSLVVQTIIALYMTPFNYTQAIT
jgi:hypothetical protein